MIGCYDFCGHYDWTFAWIRGKGGDDLLRQYWEKAIAGESQTHAEKLIREKGFAGMEEYWGHTLDDEAPDGGYRAWREDESYHIEMTRCPSRGFLLDNHLEFSGDYCDHCIGWIKPLMDANGFEIKHAHNHQGQCYWHIYREQQKVKQMARDDDDKDGAWKKAGCKVDKFGKDGE